MKLLSRTLFVAVLAGLAVVLIASTSMTALAASTVPVHPNVLSLGKHLYGTTTPSPNSNPKIAAQDVFEYILSDGNEIEVRIITFGGTITSIRVGNGKNAKNIVLGFQTLKDYETKNGGPLTPAPHTGPYFGGIIGRYGNRIANGTFTLDGVVYCLDRNNNNNINSLHGGVTGFNAVVWEVVKEINEKDRVGIELRFVSKAGEGFDPNDNNNAACVAAGGKPGYPGDLDTHVTYTLNKKGELRIDYRATTTAKTVVNLTNHSYWNLMGEGTGTIYDHRLMLNANKFTPVDALLIPTGIAPVNAVFNFSKAKPIGQEIRSADQQIVFGRGYDHNWVLNPPKGKGLNLAATLSVPGAGHSLQVWTDQPGIQFYAGNFLDGSLYGTSNHAYRQSDGLALETQHYPDSPNHPAFPSTVLDVGQTYASTTIFGLGANEGQGPKP